MLLPLLVGFKKTKRATQHGGEGEGKADPATLWHTLAMMVYISGLGTEDLKSIGQVPNKDACGNVIDSEAISKSIQEELAFRNAGGPSDLSDGPSNNTQTAGSMVDIVPMSVAHLSKRGRTAELERKRRAWARLVPARSPLLF